MRRRLSAPIWLISPRLLTPVLAVLLAVANVGCSASPMPDPVAPVSMSNQPAIEVSPKRFATEAHRLLLNTDRTAQHKLKLAGVVQYQLARAEMLFESGNTAQAEDVVTGALLLLRHDDELISATRGQEKALFLAAHAAARTGDAGRAEALYLLCREIATDKKIRSDSAEHIKALVNWNKSTDGPSQLESVGEQTRRALAAAVVDPRADAYLDARDGIVRWMQTALSSSAGETQPMTRQDREQALEAYRAIRTGAPALVALSLRQGSPGAALSALEEANLDRAIPPGLYGLIEAAQKKDDPDAWLELFRQLDEARGGGGAETRLPRYVTDAATFWAAIKLYQSGAGALENAMPLAMVLVEFGMPEVASTLLSQNVTKNTEDAAIAWSVSLVLRGLLELSQTDQLHAARRSYQEAGRLLARADQIGGEEAGSARAEFLMAALETRHGHVDRALPLLETSTRRAPNAEALLRLALLQNQQGQPLKAKHSILSAVELAQKSGNLLLEARAEEALFRAHRASGDNDRAGAALKRALSRTLVLRQMEVAKADTPTIERQLARLLGYYGRDREMREAYLRALEASRNSVQELEITLTDMSRAALTIGDIKLSRRATQSALDLGLPPENSIYIALWQQMLERRVGTSGGGITQEVLARAGKARGWLGTLRRFGLGEIPASELVPRAHGIPEKAEAHFYQALSQNSSRVDRKALAPVAESAAVDLIEVRIAQDLVMNKMSFELPGDTVLP